ncbi:FecCD family ABC transporter permease [Treponema pedis]|uniref:Transport system permease n=1 Tax=Treponema pedis str. T A4 TaxID=1291379 RepID=S5ZZZ3_9SPIR|nr:iron ABC transporter permease [Treponema pedis]AGT43963.1 transport system permease [Treponema pedis str. T A4]QSI04698.1 iron ABC transporter permease [Treponema pedis]
MCLNKKRFIPAVLFTLLIGFAVIISGVSFGSENIAVKDSVQIIFGKLFSWDLSQFKQSKITILWNMRLPRMILALAVGGGLAIGGCAMQALTQNILADPYILGVSSGASVMVSTAFLLFGGKAALSYIAPLFAFFGALLAMVIVYIIGMRGKKVSTNNLVLTGMAVSVVLNAMSHLIITMLPNAFIMESAAMWMWGTLSAARWHNILLPVIVSFLSMIVFSIAGGQFDLFSLGEETAVTLGIDTNRLKKIIIVFISILIGTIISASGLIGFIGFIIPHTTRMIFGSNNRRLFIMSFIVGGIFLACMDILSRTLLAPKEIAVGIFSAFFGGPFFIYLIIRKKRTGSI